jgi:hypothetical protein
VRGISQRSIRGKTLMNKQPPKRVRANACNVLSTLDFSD